MSAKKKLVHTPYIPVPGGPPAVWNPFGGSPESALSVAELCEKWGGAGEEDAPPGRGLKKAFLMLGSHERLSYLYDRLKEISLEELRECWLDAWNGANLMMPGRTPTGAQMIRVFRRTGFLSDTDPPPEFGETTVLYRGCLTRTELSMAWTLDPKVAEDFAAGKHMPAVRDAGPGIVLRAECPRRAILAFAGARGESEVVIDPRMLTKIETIKTVERRAGA